MKEQEPNGVSKMTQKMRITPVSNILQFCNKLVNYLEISMTYMQIQVYHCTFILKLLCAVMFILLESIFSRLIWAQ